MPPPGSRGIREPWSHNEKLVPPIHGFRGPFQRKMATLRSQSYGIWLGPCTEQSEETAVWDPQFPCVFAPEEPYYTSPNDHTRPLGDAGENGTGALASGA